jgi:hypothetical protein
VSEVEQKESPFRLIVEAESGDVASDLRESAEHLCVKAPLADQAAPNMKERVVEVTFGFGGPGAVPSGLLQQGAAARHESAGDRLMGVVVKGHRPCEWCQHRGRVGGHDSLQGRENELVVS